MNTNENPNQSNEKQTKTSNVDAKIIDKKIKKHSLNMYKIQLELNQIADQLDEKNKKELIKNIKLINKIDNDLLKAFDVKFTNQQKEDFIDLMN